MNIVIDTESDFYSFFVFKQKTAYEVRISDWSSDVCSSDLKGSGNGIADHTDLKHHGEVAMPSEVRIRLAAFDDGAACEVGRQSKQIGRASCRERVCQYV